MNSPTSPEIYWTKQLFSLYASLFFFLDSSLLPPLQAHKEKKMPLIPIEVGMRLLGYISSMGGTKRSKQQLLADELHFHQISIRVSLSFKLSALKQHIPLPLLLSMAAAEHS